MGPDARLRARIEGLLSLARTPGPRPEGEPRMVVDDPAEVAVLREALRAFRLYARRGLTRAARRAEVRRRPQLVGWAELEAARSALGRAGGEGFLHGRAREGQVHHG